MYVTIEKYDFYYYFPIRLSSVRVCSIVVIANQQVVDVKKKDLYKYTVRRKCFMNGNRRAVAHHKHVN